MSILSQTNERYDEILKTMEDGASVFRRPSKQYKDVQESLKQIVEMQKKGMAPYSLEMVEAQEKLEVACGTYMKEHAGARRTARGEERFNLISDLRQENRNRYKDVMYVASFHEMDELEGKSLELNIPVKGEKYKNADQFFAEAEEVNLDMSPEEKGAYDKTAAERNKPETRQRPARPEPKERSAQPARPGKKVRGPEASEIDYDFFKDAVEVDLGLDDKAPEEKKAAAPEEKKTAAPEEKKAAAPQEKKAEGPTFSDAEFWQNLDKKSYNMDFSKKYDEMRKAAGKNPSPEAKNMTAALAQMVYLGKSDAKLTSPEMVAAQQQLGKACEQYAMNPKSGDKKMTKLVADVKNLNDEYKNVMDGKAPEKKAAEKSAAGKDKKGGSRKAIPASALEDKKKEPARKREPKKQEKQMTKTKTPMARG